ncbi:MAG: DUF1320 domain-containing protein [Nitrospiraceae bacterium]|nr:DUF1320 domain-containing protein [Nitrospiraceae bacterium]
MYCQITDIQNVLREDALIELTDDENLGQINEGRVNECIARADATINAACSSKYIVPFAAPVPDLVRMLSEDLAIYYLYSRRGEAIPESVGEKFKAAKSDLLNIAKGIINLGVADAAAPAVDETEIGVNTSTDGRVFTDDNTPGLGSSGSSMGGY